MLYDLSPRSAGPYVVVNCAAISHDLFESEMFGRERDAFTGAARRRKGLIELAHGGNLFLDEITELSVANQAHLLRAVETGSFRPVGAENELKVDVRIISATNRPIPDTEQRYFRSDLYHRLSGIVIKIKPLQEHKEDIPELADYFLKQVAPHAAFHPSAFTKEAMDKLRTYHWPGNIRELRNVVERVCYLAQSAVITESDISLDDKSAEPRLSAFENASLEDLEREYLLEKLRQHNNNVNEVARALGVSQSTMYNKLGRHRIKPRRADDNR